MTLMVRHVRRCSTGALRSQTYTHYSCLRSYSQAVRKRNPDDSVSDRVITDEYATVRDFYELPKHPMVFAHGLMGFDELHLIGNILPGLKYWRGIVDELRSRGVEVITAAVPPSGAIEDRAAKLGERIAKKANGKSVNIIAHSMGGLDSRYMVSKLRPPNVDVKSLTTVATPHRGSVFADYLMDEIGPKNLPKIYRLLESMGLETKAFSQLTSKYVQNEFNPQVPDVEGIRYFSYGSSYQPALWSSFRLSHDVMKRLEDSENDGLVSVESSKWGEYKGTLEGCSHLDVINWTNWNVRFWSLLGQSKKFNAVAFYLDIADMLAKEGL